MGILLGIHSMGAAARSSFGGFIFAEVGNYSSAALTCAGMCVVVGSGFKERMDATSTPLPLDLEVRAGGKSSVDVLELASRVKEIKDIVYGM